jgi:hypothetical protein
MGGDAARGVGEPDRVPADLKPHDHGELNASRPPDPAGPGVWKPQLARVDAQNRVRNHVRRPIAVSTRLNDENSREKVLNVQWR